MNAGAGNNGACQVRNYSTDWARFGLDWQPAYVAWYIDGVKCGQFNGNATTIECGPMQLILHMMIDNQWERSVGPVLSSQTLVRQLQVDYIRIYQQRESGLADGYDSGAPPETTFLRPDNPNDPTSKVFARVDVQSESLVG